MHCRSDGSKEMEETAEMRRGRRGKGKMKLSYFEQRPMKMTNLEFN